MTGDTENTQPTGAPLDDDPSTTQDLRAALSRAGVDDAAALADAPAATPDPVQSTPAEPLPTAAPAAGAAAAAGPDAFAQALGQDGPAEPAQQMIQVPADHPIAQFYAPSPEPPVFKGNRGAGILISLLAGVAFAAILAAIIAALIAPMLTPSQFSVAIVEYLLSLAFLVPVAVFTVGLIVLVLIVNRAGWWAYVLGGFVVGVAVWFAAVGGWVLSPDLSEMSRQEGLQNLITVMLLPLPILAGVAAREITVWFGAWIGARGRKVRARNEAALAEYELALAELQAESANAASAAPSVSGATPPQGATL